MKFLIAMLTTVLMLPQSPVGAAPVLVVQAGPRGAVRALQTSPDGTRLASLSDEALQVWTRGGELVWSKPMLEPEEALAWSNDGRKVAVGVRVHPHAAPDHFVDSAGALELDARSGAPLRTLLSGSESVESLRYLPDGDLRVEMSGRPTFWNEAGQQKTRSFLVWPRATFDGLTLRFLKEGGQTERSIALFPTQSQPKIITSAEHAIAFSTDGATVFCTRTDFPNPRDDGQGNFDFGVPRAYLWRVDVRSGRVQTLKRGTKQAILSLGCWPDGTLILGGASGDDPEIWDGELRFATLKNDVLRPSWKAPQPLSPARHLQISPDGQTLALGGEDTAIRLWNLRDGRLGKTLKTLSSGIQALDFSPDGRQIAALDYDHLFVWNIARQTARRFDGLPVYEGNALGLDWSPNGQSLALGGGSDVKIWNAATLKEREFRVGQMGVYAPLQWTSSGIWTAGGVYNPLELHDPKTSKIKRGLDATGAASERGHDGPVNAFQFYACGQRLWTLGGDTDTGIDIKRWDVIKNRVERTLKEVFRPRAIALSPDEATLAVAAASGVLAFDSTTLAPLWKADFEAPANDLTWSRDGKWLFITGEDGWTRVLDAAGHLRRRFAALPARSADSTGYEWVSLDENGGFLASKDAAKWLRWREGDTVLPFASQSARRRLQLTSLVSPPQQRAPSGPIRVAAAPKTALRPARFGTKKSDGPILVLQGSIPSQPRALAVSSGGKWLALGDPLILLDGRSGLQWGKLSDEQEPLFFTPDATRLFVERPDYSGGGANRVQMLAIPSGKVLRSFALPSAPLWSDGKRLRGLINGRVAEFDLTTGKLRLSQPLQSAPKAGRLEPRWSFSANGAYVIEGSAGVIRFWRARDGHLLGQIKDPLRAIGKTAISSDGLYLASEGDDPNWERPTDAASEAAYARTFNIHVWNARTRKVIRTFEGYYSLDGGARLLRFSPDGATLFAAGDNNGLARFNFKIGTSAPLPPPQKDFRARLEWPIAVSSDGKWLAGTGQIYQSSDFAPGLQLWDIARSRRQVSFAGTLRGAAQVKWSPDGQFLAGGYRLTLWNARTGQLLAEKPDSYLQTFRWLSNTRIQNASLQYLNEWSAPNGAQLSQQLLSPPTQDEPFGAYSDGANFSPDGQLFLSGDPKGRFGGGGNSLFVRDVKTLAVHREIGGFDTGFTALDRIVWTPDSQHILHGNKVGFEMISVETGEREVAWHDPIDPEYRADSGLDDALSPLAVSGDGTLAAVRSARDNSLLIYDLRTRKFLTQLVTKTGYRAQFLRDNRTLVSSGAEGLEWWDARGDGQKPQRVVRGAFGSDWDIAPNEKLIAFGTENSAESGVEIWNLARGARVLTLLLLGGNSGATSLDWIALTPQGGYDASPEGEKRLRWREGGAFWPLKKSRAQFKNAAKVRDALSGEP